MKNISLYLLTILIWGSTWYGIKLQLGAVTPLLSVSYRFGLAALILMGICAISGFFKHKLTLKQHGFIAIQGVLIYALSYWMTYTSTTFMASGLVAVCFSTLSIFNVFNQHFFFKTPINRNVLFGTLMGLCGIALLFWPEIQEFSFKDKTILGVGACLLGVFSVSLGNMAGMRNGRENIPIHLSNGFSMGYGALIAFLMATSMGAPIVFDTSPTYIFSMAYLVVFGSVIAFWSYFTLVRSIGADRAGYSAVLFPVVALFISTFLEGYVWKTQGIAGVVLILAGNVLAMRRT